MITHGEYRDVTGTYGIIVKRDKPEIELLVTYKGQVQSSFKHDRTGDYLFLNKKARDVEKLLTSGLNACTIKNGSAIPFVLGTSVLHQFIKTKVEYMLELYNGELVGAEIKGTDTYLHLEYSKDQTFQIPSIPYIRLTSQKDTSLDLNQITNLDDIKVRTVAEIALEKENLDWLKNKRYFIVNDDADAERLFSQLDNYKGPIAYDTETTGLKINCFGKINSDYSRQLAEYNQNHPEEPIRADRMVGIIFCVEANVSYYFPAFNRKFKNLYSDVNSPQRISIIQKAKAEYTVGSKRDLISDMASYVRDTAPEDWSNDVVLMERVRGILETRHLVGHNAPFDWKVDYLYEIDTNFLDDTMVMHQLMYKFRSTTSNRGEPSGLKYLEARELNMYPWDLNDFFPDFKEDKAGLTREKAGAKKKSKARIDFSYMDYDGTKIYAPADGDGTFQLFIKYKQDMITNFQDMEYIYQVEIIVGMCIAYMEFYGHRLDEGMIETIKNQTNVEISLAESKIRQAIGYCGDAESKAYADLTESYDKYTELTSKDSEETALAYMPVLMTMLANLKKAIEEDEEHVINLSSPTQVSTLFYDTLNIPLVNGSRSVAKSEIKALTGFKNPDETLMYPIVGVYSTYKKLYTLVSKFFDNLPYFMYPGGYIFSSFGQISTATGRMSCSKPNAQQYPHSVTKIVKPRPGFVMADADFSQIEYRVLTALAGNKELAALFEDPDSDYHTLMAALMYEVPYASVTPAMRSAAKSFNFGIPYGMGFNSLAKLLTGNSLPASVEEAKLKYEMYFKNQPMTRKFFDMVKEQAQVNKFTQTFWHRRRYYSFEDKDGTINQKRKGAALRQAGNAVIQGTAADVFKISVARNFSFIRENKLLGKLLIINMIHDEQLFEIDTRCLNAKKVVTCIGENMQFKIDGFPPLFVGAGLGSSWDAAKGKMAEVHPRLLEQWTKETSCESLWVSNPIINGQNCERSVLDPNPTSKAVESKTPTEWLTELGNSNQEFCVNTVKAYLMNPDNKNKIIAPHIGGLLNLKFSYGHCVEKDLPDDQVKRRCDEVTKECLVEFLAHYNLSDTLNPSEYLTQSELDIKDDKKVRNIADQDDDAEYDDDDGEDDFTDLDSIDYGDTCFSPIDESDKAYGCSIQDIIAAFGNFVSKSKKVCGIDTRNMSELKKTALIEYLYSHICEPDDTGAMEILFLQECNILKRTTIYVNNIDGSEVEKRLKQSSFEYNFDQRVSS